MSIFYVGNDNNCIQYVSLFDHLICIEKDVSVLAKAGIIINEIGGSSIECLIISVNLLQSQIVATSTILTKLYENIAVDDGTRR